MGIALQVIGVVLILISLQDQFQTLFHPAGHGTLSDFIGRMVWRSVRMFTRWRLGLLTLAGPLAMLFIILAWGMLIVLGWALLYWPHLPSFVMMPGLDASRHHTFIDALNISLGSLMSLAGDMMPTTHFPRFLMGLQGVEGFALLTASVSWLLSVYPVLESARSFAQEAMSLYQGGRDTGVDIFELPEAEVQSLIHGLAVQLANVRNQMVQFPVTYYFNVGERKTGLSVVMPFVAYVAQGAEHDERAGVRVAGSQLRQAIDSFVEFVADSFLHMPKADRVAALVALARDHLTDPIGLELLRRPTTHEELRKAS